MQWQVSVTPLKVWAAQIMLCSSVICQSEFHCGQYDVDVHISVADAAPNEDPPSSHGPDDCKHEPETKTYAELTAFFPEEVCKLQQWLL